MRRPSKRASSSGGRRRRARSQRVPARAATHTIDPRRVQSAAPMSGDRSSRGLELPAESRQPEHGEADLPGDRRDRGEWQDVADEDPGAVNGSAAIACPLARRRRSMQARGAASRRPRMSAAPSGGRALHDRPPRLSAEVRGATPSRARGKVWAFCAPRTPSSISAQRSTAAANSAPVLAPSSRPVRSSAPGPRLSMQDSAARTDRASFRVWGAAGAGVAGGAGTRPARLPRRPRP